MRDKISRRRFVAATAAASAAVAGCSGPGGTETTDDGDATETTDDTTTEPATDTETSTEQPTTTAESSVPEDASVSLSVGQAESLDGLYSPLMTTFEAENFTVEPSGEVNEGAGHFHLMIDVGPVESGETIPNDAQHLHYGDGSARDVLDLEPGEYELTLQMGDGAHTALPLTDTRTITVDGESSISLDAPEDGAEFASDETITFEPTVENAVVEASGDINQNAGHHHLLVNTDPVETGEVIPSDDQHIHFGDGTETPEVDAGEFGTGDHELQFQLANGAHEAYPLTTDPIQITVIE
jgi:hypothetical protein